MIRRVLAPQVNAGMVLAGIASWCSAGVPARAGEALSASARAVMAVRVATRLRMGRTSLVGGSARHWIGATVACSIEGGAEGRRHPEGPGASITGRDTARPKGDEARIGGLYGGPVKKFRWITRDRTVAGRRAPSLLDWLGTVARSALARGDLGSRA